jgi:lipopolysaccharide/colanic/teichoic acid biosynthesis glycosyltransferase
MIPPIFFKQKRMGQNKKSFTMYKFRTMYVGAHRHQKRYKKLNQAPGPMFKIFDDPRFVGIGKFLSRSGLDELPQIINVIKGEMNLVGPRPLPVAEAQKLDKSWDFRYQVKPGIFSEWTASPLRHKNLLLWKELDKLTVEHCLSQKKPWYSFHIIIKTIWQQLR